MDLRIFYILILSVVPFLELRAGLPVFVYYAQNVGIPISLVFGIIVIENILLIFFVYFFLDKIHKKLLGWNFYSKVFHKYVDRIRGKIKRFERNHHQLGFLALMLFVGLPLPGTGVWSATLISWILNLERRKSVFYMALGVILCALIILYLSLGILSFF